MRWRQGREGFTLVELVVTVAIIALIGSVSLLSVSRLMEQYQLTAAQATLAATLREAQVNAYRQGGNWRVLIDPDAPYELLLQKPFDGSTAYDCSDDWQTVRTISILPVRVRQSSLTCITFDAYGRVQGAAPSASSATPGIMEGNPDDEGTPVVLVDGDEQVMGPEDTEIAPGWYYWSDGEPTVTVVVDAGELRAFRTVEVGILTNWSDITFPSALQLRASKDNAVYECIGDYTVEVSPAGIPVLKAKAEGDSADGCPDPSTEAGSSAADVTATCGEPNDADAVICRFVIPVPTVSTTPVTTVIEYRHFELSLELGDGALYLDEVDLHDPFFTLEIGERSGDTTINPVSGRITNSKGN